MMLNIYFHVLIAIYVSSLVNFVFISFAHVFIGLFAFLLLNFENSLYILDTSPLLDMWFANIFFPSL